MAFARGRNDPRIEIAEAVAATRIVNAIDAGIESDSTNGPLYYTNLKESTSGWFFHHIVNGTVNHPLRATVGHQVFYG